MDGIETVKPEKKARKPVKLRAGLSEGDLFEDGETYKIITVNPDGSYISERV